MRKAVCLTGKKKIKFGKFESLLWSVVLVPFQRKGNGMWNEKKEQNNV